MTEFLLDFLAGVLIGNMIGWVYVLGVRRGSRR
jgi:F0F1-type ATP synthase assembly protein I